MLSLSTFIPHRQNIFEVCNAKIDYILLDQNLLFPFYQRTYLEEEVHKPKINKYYD